MNSDDLGEKGQHHFASICAESGMVCNQALRDRMGWDFIVESRFEDGAPLAFDKRPKPLSCHFQVKAVTAGTGHIKMRLSSAEYIAKELKPSFVYVLVVDDAWVPVEAYLIHLLDEPLAEILKRLRAASARGATKVNTSYISMAFKKYGTKIGTDSKALWAAIHSACGRDAHAYIDVKKRQLETLGYEGAPISGTMTLNAPDIGKLVDAWLGLEKEVEVTDFRAFETRFGIEGPIVESSGGKITITPHPVDTCKLTFRNGRNQPVVYLGELFVPAIASAIPKEAFKALIKVGLFTVELRHGNITITLEPEIVARKRATISEWGKYFRFLGTFATRKNTVEIAASRVALRLKVPLSRMKGLDGKKARYWADICDRIAELFKRAGAYPEPELSIEEIKACWDQALSLSALVRGELNSATLTMVPGNVPFESFKPMKAIYADFIQIGSMALAVAATGRAKPERRGTEVEWSLRKFAFKEARVIASRQEYDDFVSELNSSSETLVFMRQQLFWDGDDQPSQAA